jgi:hypothetical protein
MAAHLNMEVFRLTNQHRDFNKSSDHSAQREISSMSIISISPDQVSSELGEEAVILNVKTGIYFGLNEVGARIWKLIQEPVAISRVVQTLLNEYDVEQDQCEQEVLSLIQDLMNAALVEVHIGKDHQVSAA